MLETMKEKQDKPKYYPYLDIVFLLIMVGFTILTLFAPFLFPR